MGPTRLGRDQAVATRAPRVSRKGDRVGGRAMWQRVSCGEVFAVGAPSRGVPRKKLQKLIFSQILLFRCDGAGCEINHRRARPILSPLPSRDNHVHSTRSTHTIGLRDGLHTDMTTALPQRRRPNSPLGYALRPTGNVRARRAAGCLCATRAIRRRGKTTVRCRHAGGRRVLASLCWTRRRATEWRR